MLLDVPIEWALKQAVVENSTALRAGAAVAGGVQYWIVADAIRAGGLGKSNALWDGLSTVATLGLGVLYYGERLDTQEWLGISFILAGLAIIAAHDLRR